MPLTEGARAFLDIVAGAPPLDTQSADRNRADLVAAVGLTGRATPVHDVRDAIVTTSIGGVPARVYRVSEENPAPAVVYLHGGGWALGGGLELFDTTCRDLAVGAEATVVAVDYRLAPEHPFPAALEDALAVVTALLDGTAGSAVGGVDPLRVAVVGDSAGGNLAAVCALRLRDHQPGLRHQGLVYPVTDARVGETASYAEFGEGHFLTTRDMAWFVQQYAPAVDPADPDLSPARAPALEGLVPATVVTAEYDPLRDEGEAYAVALRNAGVDVEARRVPGVVHPFLALAGLMPEALETREYLGRRLRQALRPGPGRALA